MNKQINISDYLKTIINEKGISLDYNIIVKSNCSFGDYIIPLWVLIVFIDTLDHKSHDKIKEIIAYLNKLNKHILEFFEFIAEMFIRL